MDMNLIALKVDPGQAATTLDQFAQKLRGTETQSQMTQAAFEKLNGAFKSMAQAIQQEQTALARIPLNNLAQGFGQLGEMMARVQAVSDRLARANDPLAQGFGRVAQQMQREQEVLMGIRAPQMEYFDTLTALDKLLERNAISTAEYAQQVTRLNQSMGSTQTPSGSGSSMFSHVGTILSGGAVGASIAGVIGVGHQIDDLVRSSEQLDDTYSELYNHALKFTDASHDVNAVLAQQAQLADALHETMKNTADAYDSVQDATVDLNLSNRDLVALTKSVGEAAAISGRSMSSAGDVLNRMVLAMDSGADAGRALRQALVGYDAISDALTAHFHTTRAGLVELGNQHKITSKDIIDALIAESAGIEDNFNKRKVTNEQERALVAEREAIFRKDTGSMAAFMEATDPALRKFDLDMRSWMGTLNDSGRAAHFVTDEVMEFRHQLELLYDKQNNAVREGTAGFVAGLVEVAKGVSSAVSNYDDLAKKLSIVDPWHVATDAAKKYQDQLSGVRGQLDAIFAQLDGHAEKVAHSQALVAADHADLSFAAGSTAPMTATEEAARKYRLDLAQLNDMIERGVVDQDEANNRLAQYHEELNRGFGAVDANVQRQKDLQKVLDEIHKPQQDFQYGVEMTNQLLHDHAISADEAAQHIQQLKDAYDATLKHSNDFATGLGHGWHDIVKQATDSGGQIQSAMTGAFGAIQQSLEDMVLKGKLDLSSLGSALESILVKLAVQQATGALIGAIGGGMTGFDYVTPSGGGRYALPGFSTGGDAIVAGAGGPDSKLAMFRVTPGESIHVRTPQQREAAMVGGGGSGPSHTILNLNYDPRAIRQGKDIETGVMAAIRSNAVAIRTLLGV